jgi:hypothetical protein
MVLSASHKKEVVLLHNIIAESQPASNLPATMLTIHKASVPDLSRL